MNNSSSTAANGSVVKPLKEKHDSNEEHSVSDHINIQGIPLVDSKTNGATTTGEGSNFHVRERSMAQKYTNMNNGRPHTTTLSNDTQPSILSFGIEGSSLHLTSYLVASYSHYSKSVNNKDKEPGNGQLQQQQQSSI